MLPLLEANPRLPLFHINKHFIWIEETGKLINEFEIGYMINPSLFIIKASRYQV